MLQRTLGLGYGAFRANVLVATTPGAVARFVASRSTMVEAMSWPTR
jgi:hypothetical protein